MDTASTGIRLSTSEVPVRERHGWLREVIGREYADVEISPPAGTGLFTEMTIYPWQNLRLSAIRSSPITIERLPREPRLISQDAYFAVVLNSGDYLLEQNGREVSLTPGDMTLYDATRPHRIYCHRHFSGLIVSVPRRILREKMGGVDYCTALRIPGAEGMGAVTSNFIRASSCQAGKMDAREFSVLAEHTLDLLTLALTAVRPQHCNLSHSRAVSINRIKAFVESNLSLPELDTAMIAKGVALSPRYINELFNGEDTTLMRHVWKRRLENCRKNLLDSAHAGHRISDIAFRWGFNDLSHFSRTFRQQFGCSPRDYRKSMGGDASVDC